MMKTLFALFTLTTFLCTPLAHAEEETFYYDEDEELFNRGAFVGEETDYYARQVRRIQYRNWGIAFGSTLAAAAAFVFVGLTSDK